MDTGDLLLFHGEHFWFSSLIEYATHSEFSHCGIVINIGDKKYMLESGLEYKNGNRVLGVQLTNIDLLLATYTGIIYSKKLENYVNPIIEDEILEIFSKIKGDPYDYNPLHLLEVYFKIDEGNQQRTTEFFCSALVAYIYTELGLLSKDTEWDLFTPQNICDLKLLQGASFGPLITVKSNTLFN